MTRQPALPAIALLVCGLAAASGLAIVSAPLPVLLDHFVPDDAFYYFQTARHYAATGASTFDGLHVTSGYQPLWFAICVALFKAFPAGGETPLRLLIALQAMLTVGTVVVFFRSASSIVGPSWAGAAAAAWLVIFHRATVNGLETGLHCLLFAIVLRQCLPAIIDAIWTPSIRAAATMGLTSAALVLTRVDALLLVLPLAAWWLARSRERASRAWIAYAAPTALALGGYFVWNLTATGDLLPVSGAVKIFHSSVLRDLASHGGSSLPAIGQNLLWPFAGRRVWVGAALLLGVALVVLAARAPAGSAMRRHRHLWPLVAGVWATYLFYGVVFFGEFSRTIWYYGPLTLIGGLAGCVVGRELFDRALAPGTAARWGGVVLASAVLVSCVQIARVWRDTRQPPAGWNYHLYVGAIWARETLPADAVVWSSSAGILGYFSDRRVVNTDGLANTRAFLDAVLRQGPAALRAYTRQWDYGIDAFAGADPAARFPEGCAVPLPPGIAPPPFRDGDRTRRLGVYQMHQTGLVTCRDLR